MGVIIDDPGLRQQWFVFSGRQDAGRHPGAFPASYLAAREAVVMAIPAGGVTVAMEIARAPGTPLGLPVVRKIPIPGTSGSGFGTITGDGQVLMHEHLRSGVPALPPSGLLLWDT